MVASELAGDERRPTQVFTNEHGQPVGFPVDDWSPPPRPNAESMVGRYTRLERLAPARHASDLFAELCGAGTDLRWTYLPYGPFRDLDEFRQWLEVQSQGDDPWYFAILDGRSGRAMGLASYLRITPAVGVIEVGHIVFSPSLSRTRMATEAMYLLMEWVFRNGYRRYEWKCDALNGPSRQAAERLGFSFEGIFRQATLYRGRNRDTAWYAMLDRDWPTLRAEYERWLSPGNFECDGGQRTALRVLPGGGPSCR